MEIIEIKKALIEQKNLNLPGNLYHKTQIDFAYNTNHMEGSTITSDETASIYDTGTILTSNDKVIVLKDATETKNHFTLFKWIFQTNKIGTFAYFKHLLCCALPKCLTGY